MSISKNVIIDLLPAYLSQECSKETKELVESYIQTDPTFATEIRAATLDLPGQGIQVSLEKKTELIALKRTRSILKWRSFLLAFAIMFSLSPFAFFFSNGTMHWYFQESPNGAIFSALLGAVLWFFYFRVSNTLKDL